MSADVQIRKATENDAEIIALLGRVTFAETFGHFFRDQNDLLHYFERTFSVQKVRSGFANPNNVFWIATMNELPVGYAKLKLNSFSEFIIDQNTSQLQKIYVLKDFLAQKIGLKLQDEMLKIAKESGSTKIWLSVLQENERAIGFYQKNNFQKIGEHDFQIGKESFHFHVMAKDL
jgi:ribosomal protein S18 acetylase RimI-like enzyme